MGDKEFVDYSPRGLSLFIIQATTRPSQNPRQPFGVPRRRRRLPPHPPPGRRRRRTKAQRVTTPQL